MTMAEHDVDVALLRRAVRHLLEQGAAISLIGDTDVPAIEMAGVPVSASQVILRAYAAGLADAV